MSKNASVNNDSPAPKLDFTNPARRDDHAGKKQRPWAYRALLSCA